MKRCPKMGHEKNREEKSLRNMTPKRKTPDT